MTDNYFKVSQLIYNRKFPKKYIFQKKILPKELDAKQTKNNLHRPVQ